jgi:hypothetical protein
MSVLASAVSSSLSVIELQPARNDRDKTSQFRKGTFYELVSPVFFNRFWFAFAFRPDGRCLAAHRCAAVIIPPHVAAS